MHPILKRTLIELAIAALVGWLVPSWGLSMLGCTAAKLITGR